MKKILLIILLLIPTQSFADDYWWQQLKSAAASCFNGRNIKVEVIAGASAKTLGDRAKTGPFSEIRMTVPLFDQKKNQQEKRAQAEFLEHGAEIIKELGEAKARIAVKTEKSQVLKQAMIQEGLAGIEAFFQIKEEIAVLHTTVQTAELKLTGYIETCGNK